MGVIAIKHLILTGDGDEVFPLAGGADICVTVNRSGNTTIDVPSVMCLCGRNTGRLTLTGTGDVSQCGDLEIGDGLNTSQLNGTFTPGNGILLIRCVYSDHFYVAKLYVQSNAAMTGVDISDLSVIQDARRL